MATYKRRLAREKVLQTLYAYEISREPITRVMEQLFEELKDDKENFEFAKRLVHEVVQHEDEIEERIRQRVSHWEFDRIAVIDRILLRMGICELEHFPDIPPKVTINELIEVAKAFSTENSGRFVNGVLDAVLEDLRKNHTLKKTGRGLIDQNLRAEERRAARAKPPKTT